MRLILDTGALLALERNDRAMWRRLKAAQLSRTPPLTHGGVLAQSWRGLGPREALLSLALDGTEILPIDRSLGRATGELLSAAGKSDIVDAALVLLSDDGDQILTTDPDDLLPLANIHGRHIEIVPV